MPKYTNIVKVTLWVTLSIIFYHILFVDNRLSNLLGLGTFVNICLLGAISRGALSRLVVFGYLSFVFGVIVYMVGLVVLARSLGVLFWYTLLVSSLFNFFDDIKDVGH